MAPPVMARLVTLSRNTSPKAMVERVKYGPRRRKTIRPMMAAKPIAIAAARKMEIHRGNPASPRNGRATGYCASDEVNDGGRKRTLNKVREIQRGSPWVLNRLSP